jgi:hypothetical protein
MRAKDWTAEQVAEGIAICKQLGVSCIWGYGNNVSDTGSQPWPNKSEVRKALGWKPAPPPPPEPPPVEPSPVLFFSVPEEVTKGAIFLVSWEAANVDVVKLSSDVDGPIDFSLPPVGNLLLSTEEDVVYTFEAVGPGGSVFEQVEVTALEKNKPWWKVLLAFFGINV